MSFKQTKKPTVTRFIIELGENDNSINLEELKDVLSNVSFELININLSVKKSLIGVPGSGYTSIGFVNRFNKEQESFDVVVFANKAEAIEKLGDIMITARVFKNKEGKITKIIGLDVEPVGLVESDK